MLHLGQDNPRCIQTERRNLSEQPCKALEGSFLVHEKLDKSQYVLATWKTNCILSWIKRVASRARDVIVPLCSTSLTVLHKGLGPRAQEEWNWWKRSRGPQRQSEGWSTSPTKVERVGLDHSGKQKALGRPHCSVSILQKSSIINRRETNFFMWSDRDRTRGKGLNLKKKNGRFLLDIRKVFTQGATRHWNWKHSRPGWTGPWTAWSHRWQPCPWLVRLVLDDL